jgi:hypothetical protein
MYKKRHFAVRQLGAPLVRCLTAQLTHFVGITKAKRPWIIPYLQKSCLTAKHQLMKVPL